ncbi:glycosyl transferase family 90 [Helicobacter sp. 13S00477-4]|uniref:glycosyl transferase family 90 n=1 Tax=Helicobacter sp. 13S00477-4 TaxID=1905759 RepID=UPI000BA4EF7C|nr:glycosyl transferase family 90 [Helicobacter sp. 13S00477-4]PAF51549.1 lipopolysaccharide core biosynthesis protein LpsA [Helicobacter sp. 13S00477-4]
MKNNRLLYNLKGFISILLPKFYFQKIKNKIIQKSFRRKDIKYIIERVNYYCPLNNFQSLQTDSKLNDHKLTKKLTVYFFDTYEFTRYFHDDLKWCYEKGDVNYFLPQPSITKSRPIAAADKNQNSILLNIDKVRHFTFIKDPYLWENKKDKVIFRGGCYQAHRQKLLGMYFDHPLCDIGHVGWEEENLIKYQKPKISIKKHLEYKFILSIEGNDVASNLKWIMSSNSIAIMPKPKFETWFMEGKLKANYHYIQIKDDYSDLEEKIYYYLSAPNEAKKIIQNANTYVKQFFDKKREKIISILTLEKYFYHTKQIQPIEVFLQNPYLYPIHKA